LPKIDGRRWHLALDTSQDAPEDILERERQLPQPELCYRVNPRSVVVLEART
jgi:glycogen operon protein